MIFSELPAPTKRRGESQPNKNETKDNMNAKTEINGVKIGKHGVRFAGKYHPCWYSHGALIDGRVCVTIYAKNYGSLPKELGTIKNDTDMMTDYFEKDRVRFFEGTPEYSALLPFCKN